MLVTAHDRDDVAEKHDSTAADVGGLADAADLEGLKDEVANDYCNAHCERQKCGGSW